MRVENIRVCPPYSLGDLIAVEIGRSRKTHRERTRPSQLFDDDLVLVRTELLEAGVDRLFREAAER